MSIERLHVGTRMSQTVVHNGVVYLAGQVGTEYETITEQTEEILGQIDSLLAEVGSSKEKLLRAEIWLDDMRDFAEMNAAWDAWVPEGHAPARACGQAHLARQGFKVEITITAAI